MKKQVALFALLLMAKLAMTQQVFPVAVNGFMIPPHSLDLSVYTFDRSQDMIFNATLNDPVEPFRDVRLQLTIKVDNQDVYVTDPNSAFTPIRLNQFDQVTFDGSALAPYLNPMALMGASGFGMGSLDIPEGFNKICVEVVDLQQNKIISNQACAFGRFTLNQPPQLLLPACGETMELPETQNLLFNWTPMHLGSGNSPAPVEYIFELVELLPGIMDPNDGFDNALQIYQSSVMTPSLLYTQAEPQLEANKSYGWRVRAQSMMNPTSTLFQNDGISQVCTFTYTESDEQIVSDDEEDSQVVPQGCEVFSTDFGPVNGIGFDPIPLVEGDIVKLGYFEMEVLDAVPSGDGYNGNGFVAIPMLGAKVQVNFQDLKVKGSMRAYGAGLVEAIVDTEYTLDNDLLVPGNIQNIITEEYVQSLMSFFETGQGQNRLTSQFNPSDPVNTQLPLGIDKDINGEAQPLIAVTGIRFTERNAFMDCVAYQAIEGDGLLRFFEGSIPITPLGVKSNTNLSLLDEVSAPLSGIFQINMSAGGNNGGMGMDCGGYTQMNLEQQVQIDPEYMVAAGGDQPIVFDLGQGGQNAQGYVGEIEAFNDFEIPSLPGFTFEMDNGQLDLNKAQALQFATPTTYQAASNNDWEGLYLDGVKVTLPAEYDFTGNGNNFQLETGSLFLSEAGAYGNFSGNNLVDINNGRMGEWPFSVDLFDLAIEAGSPNSSSIAGKLKVPLLDDAFDYTADLAVGGTDVEIAATPAPGDYGMSMWKATFEVNEQTKVEAELLDFGADGKQFFPSAKLNGKLSLSITDADFEQYIVGDKAEKRSRIREAFDITGDLDFALNGVMIEDFAIDPTAPSIERYTLYDFGSGADTLFISGKAIPLTDLKILYDNDNGEELGLMVEGTKALSALTIIIWAKADDQGNFLLQRIETDTKKVDCDCASNDDIYFDPTKLDKYLDKHYQKYYSPGKPNYSDFSVGGSFLKSSLSQEQLDELHRNVVMNHLRKNNLNGFVVDDINDPKEVSIGFLSKDKGKIQIKKKGNSNSYEGVRDELITDENGILNYDKLTYAKVIEHNKKADKRGLLPLDITDEIDNFLHDNKSDFPSGNARLLITGIRLNNPQPSSSNGDQVNVPNGTTISLLLLVKQGDKHFKFEAKNVEIGPQEVAFDDLKLFLTNTVEIANTNDADPKNPMLLNKLVYESKPKDGGGYKEELSTGSFAYMTCEGFQHYNVQGRFEFGYHGEGSPANTIKTKNPNYGPGEKFYKNASLPFTLNGKDLDEFIAPIKEKDDENKPVTFQIDGLEHKKIHIEEAYVDYDCQNNPAGFNAATSDCFRGLVFKKIQVEVEGLMTKEGEKRVPLKIPGTDFYFQLDAGGDSGIGMHGSIDLKSDVLPKTKGADIGGWKYALSSFKFGMFKDLNGQGDGTLTECKLSGKMLIPIFFDAEYNWISFSGTLEGGLTLDEGETAYLPTGDFQFGDEVDGTALTNQTFSLDWLPNLSMRLANSSVTFTYNSNINEFETTAVLNGFAGMYLSSDFVDNHAGSVSTDYSNTSGSSASASGGTGSSSSFNFGIDYLAFQGLTINEAGSKCPSEDAVGGIRSINFGDWGLAIDKDGNAAKDTDGDGTIDSLDDDIDGDSLPNDSDPDADGNGIDDEEEEEKPTGFNRFQFSIEALLFECSGPGTWNFTIGVQLNIAPGEVESSDNSGSGPKVGGGASAAAAGGGKSGPSRTQRAKKNAKAAGLTAATQITFATKKDENGKLKFDGFQLDAVYLEGEMAGVELSGALVFIREDDLWGNGMKGYLDVKIEKLGLQLQALAQFGKTKADNGLGTATNMHDEEYRYFFIDIEFAREQGIPIGSTLALNGITGGFFLNCNSIPSTEGMMSLADQNASSSGDFVAPTIGSTTSVATECPFDDKCDPGVGLSSYTYEPSKGKNGFHFGLIMSLANKPQTLTFEVKASAEFYTAPNGGGVSLSQLVIAGDAYIMAESVLDRKDAPIVANVVFDLDLQNKEFRGALDFQMGLTQPDGPNPVITLDGQILGSIQVGLPGNPQAKKWQVKMGAPLAPNTLSAAYMGMGGRMISFYLQMGTGIDPIPSIKEIIPKWPDAAETASGRLSDSFFASGDGLVFGLKDELFFEKEAGPFTGKFNAAIGFDLSMMKYADPPPGCVEEGESIGINNWYIRGNAYAYFEGSVTMNINALFFKGEVEIFNAFAALALRAEFPNPTFFQAQFYAKYSVLGGKINGSVHLSLEAGSQLSLDCLQSGASKVPAELSIPLIGSTYPKNNDSEIPIYSNAEVAFNLQPNAAIQFPVYDDEFKFKHNEYYRPVLTGDRIYITKEGETKPIAADLTIDGNKAVLNPKGLLDPTMHYTLTVKYKWEKKIGEDGAWKTVKTEDSDTPLSVTETATFTTGGAPERLVEDAFKRSQPANGQYFWTKDYATPLIQFEDKGWENIFPASADNVPGVDGTVYYDYQVRVTEYSRTGDADREPTGKEFTFPVSEYPGMVAYETEEISFETITLEESGITLNLPKVEIVASQGDVVEMEGLRNLALKYGSKKALYKLEVIRVPIQETSEVIQSEEETTQTLSSEEGDDFALNISIPTTKLEDKTVDYGAVTILYEMWFGTSQYESFSDKVHAFMTENLGNANVSQESNPDLIINHPLQGQPLPGNDDIYSVPEKNPLNLMHFSTGQNKYVNYGNPTDNLEVTNPINHHQLLRNFGRNEIAGISKLTINPGSHEGFDAEDMKRLAVNFNRAYQFQPLVNDAYQDEEIVEDFLRSDYNKWAEDIKVFDLSISSMEVQYSVGDALAKDLAIFNFLSENPDDLKSWEAADVKGGLSLFSTEEEKVPNLSQETRGIDLRFYRPAIIGLQFLKKCQIVSQATKSFYDGLGNAADLLFDSYTASYTPNIDLSNFLNRNSGILSENYKLTLKFPDINSWTYTDEPIPTDSYNWREYTVENIMVDRGSEDITPTTTVAPNNISTNGVDENPLKPIRLKAVYENAGDGTANSSFMQALMLDWDEHAAAEYDIRKIWVEKSDGKMLSYLDLGNEEEDLYDRDGNRNKIFYDSELNAPLFHYDLYQHSTPFDAEVHIYGKHGAEDGKLRDRIYKVFFVNEGQANGEYDRRTEEINSGKFKIEFDTEGEEEEVGQFYFCHKNELLHSEIPQREKLLRFPRNHDKNPLQLLGYKAGNSKPDIANISIYDAAERKVFQWTATERKHGLQSGNRLIYAYENGEPVPTEDEYGFHHYYSTASPNPLFEMEPEAAYTIYVDGEDGDESFVTDGDYWINRGGASVYRWDESFPDAVFLPLGVNTALNAKDYNLTVNLTGSNTPVDPLALGMPFQDMTIAFWMKFHRDVLTNDILYFGSSSEASPWRIFQNDNVVYFKVKTTDGEKMVGYPAVINTETWTHIAAVYDGSQLKLIINGKEEASEPLSGVINYPGDGKLMLGGNGFKASIDELSLWSTARNVFQIKDDAELGVLNNPMNTAGGLDGLLAYYPFDQEWGDDDITDVGGTGRHGKVTGAQLKEDNIWVRSEVPKPLAGWQLPSARMIYKYNQGEQPQAISIYDSEDQRALLWLEGQGMVENPENMNLEEESGFMHFITEVTGAFTVYVRTNTGDYTIPYTKSATEYMINPAGSAAFALEETLPDAVFLPEGSNKAIGGATYVHANSGDEFFLSSSKAGELSEITIEGWIYRQNDADNNVPSYIFRHGSPEISSLGIINNKVEFTIKNPGKDTIWKVRTPELVSNKWIHVAAVYNGTEMKIYLDGQDVTVFEAYTENDIEISELNLTGASLEPYVTGGGDSKTEMGYGFKIDELAVWKTARLQEEIIADAENGIPMGSVVPDGLLAYFKFDQNWKDSETKNLVNDTYSGFLTGASNNMANFWVASEVPKSLPLVNSEGLDAVFYAVDGQTSSAKMKFKDQLALSEVMEVSLYNTSTQESTKWYGGLHSRNSAGEIDGFVSNEWETDILPALVGYDKIYVYTKSGSLYSNATTADLQEGLNYLVGIEKAGTPYDPANIEEQSLLKLDRQTGLDGSLIDNVQLTYFNSLPIAGYDVAVYDQAMNKHSLYFAGDEQYRRYSTTAVGAINMESKDWNGKYHFDLTDGEKYTFFLRRPSGANGYEYGVLNLDHQFWTSASVLWLDSNSDFTEADNLAGYFSIEDYTLEFLGSEVVLGKLELKDTWTAEGWIKAEGFEQLNLFSGGDNFYFGINAEDLSEQAYVDMYEKAIRIINTMRNLIDVSEKLIADVGNRFITEIGPFSELDRFNIFVEKCTSFNEILSERMAKIPEYNPTIIQDELTGLTKDFIAISTWLTDYEILNSTGSLNENLTIKYFDFALAEQRKEEMFADLRSIGLNRSSVINDISFGTTTFGKIMDDYENAILLIPNLDQRNSDPIQTTDIITDIRKYCNRFYTMLNKRVNDAGGGGLFSGSLNTGNLPSNPFSNKIDLPDQDMELTLLAESQIDLETPNLSKYGIQLAIDGLEKNRWYHYALTYDNKAVKFYINGTEIHSYQTIEDIALNNEHLVLGGGPYQEGYSGQPIDYSGINGISQTMINNATNTAAINNATYNKKVYLDELSFWSYAKSVEDIQQDYLYGINRNSNSLKAYYNFNDGPGSGVLRDLTGKVGPGQLQNMDVLQDWKISDRNASAYAPANGVQSIALGSYNPVNAPSNSTGGGQGSGSGSGGGAGSFNVMPPYTVDVDNVSYPILKYKVDNDWYEITEMYLSGDNGEVVKHWFNGYLYEIDGDTSNFGCGAVPDNTPLINQSGSFELYVKRANGKVYYLENAGAGGLQLMKEVDPAQMNLPEELKDGYGGAGN